MVQTQKCKYFYQETLRAEQIEQVQWLNWNRKRYFKAVHSSKFRRILHCQSLNCLRSLTNHLSSIGKGLNKLTRDSLNQKTTLSSFSSYSRYQGHPFQSLLSFKPSPLLGLNFLSDKKIDILKSNDTRTQMCLENFLIIIKRCTLRI